MNTWVEISKKALYHNLDVLKKGLNSQTKVTAVVKGNAYGHDLKVIARLLEDKVDYFQIDDFEELLELRKVTSKRAWIFGSLSFYDIEKLLDKNVSVGVYNIEQLLVLEKICKKLGKKLSIQLKIDTQLGRQGILLPDLSEALSHIKKLEYVSLEGIYSHFSDAKDPKELRHTRVQLKEFDEAIKQANSEGFNKCIKHISSTSGVIMDEYIRAQFDAVRIGAGIYGIWPSIKLKEKYSSKYNLLPVLSWKARLGQTKKVPKNFPIGYNRTYITKNETYVGVVPVGYSDGYPRILSNKGYVLLNGKKCKVVGTVSMNMFTIQIPSHDLNKDAEVVLIGNSFEDYIGAADIAEISYTINYEILSRISTRIPRIVIT